MTDCFFADFMKWASICINNAKSAHSVHCRQSIQDEKLEDEVVSQFCVRELDYFSPRDFGRGESNGVPS